MILRKPLLTSPPLPSFPLVLRWLEKVEDLSRPLFLPLSESAPLLLFILMKPLRILCRMAASEGRSTLDRKVSFIGGDRVLCVSSLSREAIKQARFSQHRSDQGFFWSVPGVSTEGSSSSGALKIGELSVSPGIGTGTAVKCPNTEPSALTTCVTFQPAVRVTAQNSRSVLSCELNIDLIYDRCNK